MSSFADGYNNFIKSSSGYGSIIGKNYSYSVEHEINKLFKDLNNFKTNGRDIQQLKGNVAEFWHCGTHNIDAAVKGVTSRTKVPESHDLGSPDITSNFGKDYGLKYYADGASSAKAQATSFFEKYMQSEARKKYSFKEWLRLNNYSEKETSRHDPLYHDQIRIIPKGQLEDAISLLERKIAKESVTRPELVKKLQETKNLLDDKIRSNEGSESIALSDADAKKIAILLKEDNLDLSKFGISTEELIKLKNLMEQSLKAGLTAGTISMVLRTAPYLYKIVEKLVQDGEVDSKQFKDLGLAALQGGSEGFVRGSVAAALTTACLSGQLGNGLKAVSPPVIGATTVIAINAIQNSFKFANGNMTKEEFADACMRDLFVSTCSIAMGGVTQGAIQIPVLGYMLGSFVGSVSASFIYNAGYSTFLSFSTESGLTFFGLVDQNYSLPKDVLEKIGMDVFGYETFPFQETPIERFYFETFTYEQAQNELLELSFVRRGVIGVNRIGYV